MGHPSSPGTPMWCLRFLSGALKGRIITLKQGNNAVGSAGDCEVMLPGGEVSPRHLMLNVGELLVSVQKVGSNSARLNGEELTLQRKSLLAGDIISVGQIELELDRSYPETMRDDQMFAWSDSMLTDESAKPPVAPASPRRPGLRVGATGVLLALAGLAAVAAWNSGDGSRRDGDLFNLGEVENALAGFPEVEILASPGGQFTVKGYVESRLRKQNLEQAMQRFGPHIVVNVQTAEEMVEQARRYVSDPGVALTYVGRGQLVASGTAEDDTVREKIRRLAEDLHPTVLVSDKVRYRPSTSGDRRGDAAAQWLAWQDQLAGRLVSITEDSSGLRHIQLSNGSRYYVGAVLRSGAELQNIQDGELTLGATPPASTSETR
jgi:type III secretion system YscD/HrpQ family protein